MASVDELRAFAAKDHRSIDDAKSAYWVEWKRVHGARGGVEMADDLRLQVRRMKPDWPDAASRAEDLASHLKLADLLRRVPARRR